MAAILMVVGIGWAVLGFANCASVFAESENAGRETFLAFAMIFNAVLFVIPGLGLAGVGEVLRKRAQKAPS